MKDSLKRIIAVGVSSFLMIPTVIFSKKIDKCDIEKCDTTFVDDCDLAPLVVETTTTCSTTTSVITTTATSTSTTIVTTTEKIDKYKNIRFLEGLKNNDLTIDELDNFIIRYCGFAKLSYDDALEVLKSNLSSIENDYQSIRGGIMCSLFMYANENGILKVHTDDREIREEMTQEDKENLMIEFCDNLCLSVEDKYIVLSAFREETGRGVSERCVYDNNYGGIRIYNEEGCNGEYGKFSTPEFGIYRQVKCVNGKLINIHNEGVYDIDSVAYEFACRYNPDYASLYSQKILGWVYDVQNDYGDFSKINSPYTYIKK